VNGPGDGNAGDGPAAVEGREAIARARLERLAAARRQLAIRLPMLEPGVLDAPAELDELRRLATAGRGALVRLLLREPGQALRDGHRLVALTQRLPSTVQVRVPVEEADLADESACLIDDAGGYLLLPRADHPRGRSARRDRGGAAALKNLFDGAWERAEPARAWQRLGL
jgi:hypothetical protein